MDTRHILDTRRHGRGAVRPVTIAIIVVLALLAVGAWFLIIQPHQELVMSDSGGHPSTPVSAATRVAPPPANLEAMDVDQLLTEARTAMNEQRYLAPAGTSAFDFYLRALEKDPGNKVATDALRETFPFAANSAEQAINSSNFNEAQRQIDLLAKADPANFTLTILRSKLDAQRKVLDRKQQDELNQQAAAALAAQKAASEKASTDKLAAEQQALAQQQAAQVKAAKVVAAKGAQTSEAVTGSDTSSVASTGGVTRDAQLLTASPARYPSAALRGRKEGWVLVSFTVDADGRTSDIKVVASKPGPIFDRAAIQAIEDYRFDPAMKNGVAVATQKQQRIEFKL